MKQPEETEKGLLPGGVSGLTFILLRIVKRYNLAGIVEWEEDGEQ